MEKPHECVQSDYGHDLMSHYYEPELYPRSPDRAICDTTHREDACSLLTNLGSHTDKRGEAFSDELQHRKGRRRSASFFGKKVIGRILTPRGFLNSLKQKREFMDSNTKHPEVV